MRKTSLVVNLVAFGLLAAADEAAKRLNRVLTNDPGLGVARHVDAGYEEAKSTARAKGVQIPMLTPKENR